MSLVCVCVLYLSEREVYSMSLWSEAGAQSLWSSKGARVGAVLRPQSMPVYQGAVWGGIPLLSGFSLLFHNLLLGGQEWHR